MKQKEKEIFREYHITLTERHLTHKFTKQEKKNLRPIAEVLAMLDGNAFFSMMLARNKDWYEQYLPEALALFESNGGKKGWAGMVSWLNDSELKNPAVKEAWENYQTMLKLARESK